MGFITNEWISPGIATGNYGVVEVRFSASRPASQFSRRHGLVLRLRAQRENSGDYQIAHFDSQDLLDFLTSSVREVEPQLRAELVAALLREMSDDELLAALDAEVSRRRRREEAVR